jgi:hypothetical protein
MIRSYGGHAESTTLDGYQPRLQVNPTEVLEVLGFGFAQASQKPPRNVLDENPGCHLHCQLVVVYASKGRGYK